MAARTTRNRQTVEKALQEARQHVAVGQRLIYKQWGMVEQLEDHGHRTRTARTLLAQLEDVQAMHIAHRDRLIRELAQCRHCPTISPSICNRRPRPGVLNGC